MIVKSGPLNVLLPHQENIVAVHNALPIIGEITDGHPVYAGGYPTALLLAPRSYHNPTKLRKASYSDYDVYFKNEHHLQEYLSALMQKLQEADIYSIKKTETNNALTLSYPLMGLGGSRSTAHVQLIKKVYGTPESILNSYDFINCAVAYVPSESTMYFHKELFYYHSNRILEVLNPWMLKDITPNDMNNANNIIIQLIRFQKYCMRWQYALGDEAFKLLLSVYHQYPHVRLERNAIYITRYNLWQLRGMVNKNIWTVMASLLKDHYLWDDSYDIYGYINAIAPEQNVQHHDLTTAPF